MVFELNDLVSMIHKILPPHLLNMFHAVCESALQMGMQIYMVGGPVRDLLIGTDIKDIDLVVEGDVESVARESAKRLGGDITHHSIFGVSTITVDDHHIDLAMARSERYSNPGALPTVLSSTIVDDLQRRDFTINAMAVKVSPQRVSQGPILDPFEGQIDIQQRLIRVLHDNSFVDDPTRILRAVRYEQRLDFSLESHTLRFFFQPLIEI